jgi:histidyl-tRNA synthetase
VSEPIAAPRGTLDWLPPRSGARRAMVGSFAERLERAGYREAATPVFEDRALFARTAGESSEVVGKEMYAFEDRGERPLALRPEFTASIVRAYLEHGLSREPQPARLWSAGSCYRYAAVQRGRYREFTQVNAEAIGSPDPAVDAELIALQVGWFAALGLEGLEIRLNTLGDPADRGPYLERLRAYIDQRRDEVDEDVRRQRDLNPLRAFDTKDPASAAVMAEAPLIVDAIGDEAAEHFAQVRAFLDARGIPYVLDPRLVRGLDYYARTTWEIAWPALGAQSGIGGGGRYDGLAELIGGPPTPGVGFACGVERVLLALEAQERLPGAPPRCDAFFMVLVPDARPRLHALMDAAREAGLACEADLAGRAAKGQMRQADRVGAARTVVCGDDEWARGTCLVRDMQSGEQVEVALDDLVVHLVRAGAGDG